MNTPHSRRHSIDTIFTIFLFGLFFIFLLLILLFSAKAYRSASEGNQRNNNLYTASAYITAKFRQHDGSGQIRLQSFEDPADLSISGSVLCMDDMIEQKNYVTYIYLADNCLKELFTTAEQTPDFGMGTKIADLQDFTVTEDTNGSYQICLTDMQGYQSRFLLHCGVPSADSTFQETMNGGGV